MPDVLAVAQFIGQPLHIVVIREVIEPGIVAEALQTPHGMGDLEIVVVVVATPQTLMQFVVGDGVEMCIRDRSSRRPRQNAEYSAAFSADGIF